MAQAVCKFDGCKNPSRALGLCPGHWQQQHRGKELAPLLDWQGEPRPWAPDGFAYCTSCRSFKEVEEFYLLSNGRTRSTCKECTKRANTARARRRREAA